MLYTLVQTFREFFIENVSILKGHTCNSFNLQEKTKNLGILENNTIKYKSAPFENFTSNFESSIVVDELKNSYEPTICSGEKLTIRKSTFQVAFNRIVFHSLMLSILFILKAHVVKVCSELEVKIALNKVKSLPKVISATHNMYAYRILKRKKDGGIFFLHCQSPLCSRVV
jgi:hypothetical protein